MAVAFLIRFKTSQSNDILTQLRAYKERELDRHPPDGFLSARILASADKKTVAFYTEWEDADALDESRDSAPWEACMDLNDIHAEGRDETVFDIA